MKKLVVLAKTNPQEIKLIKLSSVPPIVITGGTFEFEFSYNFCTDSTTLLAGVYYKKEV